MGCGGSKLNDSPLLVRCRERKRLIRAAADHRYALAAAHLSYFRSLADVGEALRRFVEEELTIPSPPPASPELTLPSSEGKRDNTRKSSPSSTSISHHHSNRDGDDDLEGSHLQLSSSSDSESGPPSEGHVHMRESPVAGISYSSPTYQTGWAPYGPYGFAPPQQGGWDLYGMNMNSYTNTYYMKKSAPAAQKVIYEEPSDSSYMYSNSYENGGFFGFPMRPPSSRPYENGQPSPPAGLPPPPSPKVSSWDFLNPFDMYDSGYYSQGRYGYASVDSSPDSNEVRQREGIPDLEDETVNDVFIREVHKGKKKVAEDIEISSGNGTSGLVPTHDGGGTSRTVRSHSGEASTRAMPTGHGSEGSSRAMPTGHSREGSSRVMPTGHTSEGFTRAMPTGLSQNGEGSSSSVPSLSSEAAHSVNLNEEKSSSDTIVSQSPGNGYARKKGVSFEVDDASTHGVESSKLSSLTTLSAQGTRDLQEVATEIRDEFRVASTYGKEVALMLEVGKLPYQPRFAVFKVFLSRFVYRMAPSFSSSHTATRRRSVKLTFSTMKLAKSYYGEYGKDRKTKPSNLSSTLERLYVWEKKLYREVKDEERLRIIYEKKCKRLKVLDDQGAESRKIDVTQASIRKLLTKLNVCIRAIDAISSRIHKLRDEELQPQINELIHGLIRMWKSMLKCHQKQYQAVLNSKTRSLRPTGSRRDSSLRVTLELELELRIWCDRFKDWIDTQESFVESLNGWLLRCILWEPEETPDGVVPFSPHRIGAPPIFVISNDWIQAVGNISKSGMANAIEKFARILQLLSEKQFEVQISKEFQSRLRILRDERARMEHDQDGLSVISSGSGVSPLDDLKVDLDSMRNRLDEERARHKEAMKLVRKGGSSSLQAGLVPIFEALGNFSSESLKAYELVRVKNDAQGS